jgi:hypothetical protein
MASDQHSLRLAIVSPSSSRSTDDFVRLEQEPWDPYIGSLTRFGVLAYLNAMLFQADEPEPYCAGDSPTLTVYAYPSRADLNYLAGASWGTLGPRRVQEVLYTEALQLDLELEPELKYPALSIERYVWVGDAYSPAGDVLVRPAVTISGSGITIAEKVYGTLLVTYRVCRHLYSLAVQPRPDAEENRLQSFVFTCWDGGNNYIEIEAPEGAEEGACNNRGGSTFNPIWDDYTPDHVEPEDINVDVDYCTGLEIAE